MIEHKQQKKAYLAAILNAFIIGFAFIFVKLALTITNPVDTLAHRFTVSFVVASIPIIFGWIRLNIKVKDIVSILPLALFYPALFFTFQVFGLAYTSSSEAGIIHATVPIFTMVLATYFLKEYTSQWQKIFTLLSVVGVAYIFAMKGINLETTNSKGTILILLSALSFAGYSVLARKMSQKFSVIDLTYMMTTIGFLFFNGMSVIRHVSEGTLTLFFAPFSNPLFVLSILFLGVLSSLVTSFLSNYALSQIEASKISVFNNLSTLVTIVAGVIFLQEKLEYFHLIGAFMIILGVVGTNLLEPKKAKVRS
ncbi:drug/metabolite transporter (DMT)-like permease [Aneurinibacillus soli]|uniref:EamA-like transporter family protein n=1 Tax=Aneurinibacillus soli TaxID=1500254 RepID=A0A0U5C3X7_9BACL|nr:DMT family transporter [Aneurinibacillus soli]PYE61242.1 drug/metabolite transporter (DMT)-like permease [Aneurinibacillus soli]BAU26323.1 EamA-like transporter family protein [Aneurinibacillus soli]